MRTFTNFLIAFIAIIAIPFSLYGFSFGFFDGILLTFALFAFTPLSLLVALVVLLKLKTSTKNESKKIAE